MAGLLDIFGTGGADTMGLLGMSPADIRPIERDERVVSRDILVLKGERVGETIAD